MKAISTNLIRSHLLQVSSTVHSKSQFQIKFFNFQSWGSNISCYNFIIIGVPAGLLLWIRWSKLNKRFLVKLFRFQSFCHFSFKSSFFIGFYSSVQNNKIPQTANNHFEKQKLQVSCQKWHFKSENKKTKYRWRGHYYQL